MKSFFSLLLLSFLMLMFQPAYAANWLDEKRRNTINQRKENERIKLEEKRLLQQEEEAKAQERRWQAEQRQRELEQKQRELEQRLRTKEREERQEKEYQDRQKAAAAEADIRNKLKNRRLALRNFDAAKGTMWVTHRGGLFAFAEQEQCEEYVEYRNSKEAYASRYARDLLDESVIQVQKKGHLKVRDSNYEELLPEEYALRALCEDGEDVSAYETPESAAQYLSEQAMQKGIVRILTFRGEEYWVSYRDLLEYATPDVPTRRRAKTSVKSEKDTTSEESAEQED